MVLFNWTLADGIILKLGDQVWFFGANVLLVLLVGMVAGVVAESALLVFLVRRCLPLLLFQGQPAPGGTIVRSTAQEQEKTLPTEDASTSQHPGPVPGVLPPGSSRPQNGSE